MRIAIFTFGTRGDVQPYIALAQELVRRGHEVEFLGPRHYAEIARGIGVTYTMLRGNITEIIGDGELAKYERWGPVGRLYFFFRFHLMIGATNFERMTAAAKRVDCIVFSPLMHFATDLSEAFGLPVILANMQPLVATKDFLYFPCGTGSLGPRLNLLSYNLLRLGSYFFKSRLRHARESLNLEPRSKFSHPFTVNGMHVPTMHGVSTTLVPTPGDWPDHVISTGPWVLSSRAEWRPGVELQAFLDAGPAPLFVGFGSMPLSSLEDILRYLRPALECTDLRAVFVLDAEQARSLQAHDAGDRVFLSGPVPHSELLPLLRAAIHHGGAGTLAATLMAGLPTLVCPRVADQVWWGERAWGAGVGPKPLPVAKWRNGVLIRRIEDLVCNPQYADNAKMVSKAMTREGGVSAAADFVEHQVLNWRHKRT